MTKVERLNTAYEYLVWRKVIGGQEDVAVAMKSTQPNVSQALKGVPHVLTDRFIRRFCAAYPMISVDWVLREEGKMLRKDRDRQPQSTDTHSDSPNRDDATASIIELAASLIKENEALRKQLTEAIHDVRTLREDMARDREAIHALRNSLSAILYGGAQTPVLKAAEAPNDYPEEMQISDN